MNQCSSRLLSLSRKRPSLTGTLGFLSKAHPNMRVVSSLSCFAAASPLLRSQLPFTTTATSSNDVQQLRNTHLGRPSMHVQRPKQQSHPGQNNSWVRLDSGCCNSYNPALVTRGGAAVSKTEPERSPYDRLKTFLNKRFFLLGAAAMVAAARVAPSPGTTGGLLSLSVSKAGVSLVFFLVGLAIKLGELAGAALNFRLNLLTQAFSLGVLPAVGVGFSRVLAAGGMHPALADGVLILMCLPTTVNMCVILTQSAEGNTAAAAFNAVLGNLLGVVITPALLLLLLGRRLDMAPSLLATFKKLGIKVVLPLALGQLARFTPLRKLHERKPKAISRFSECVLLSIIYTTFCDTFTNTAGVAGTAAGGGGGGVLVLMAVLPIVHLLSLAALDALSRVPFLKINERDRIAVMFCGTHKTLAFGIPLIKALFEGHPSLGMLATPLLLYHPSELMLGSALAPTLRTRAEAREAAAGAAKNPPNEGN